jgi:hypothetical protein
MGGRTKSRCYFGMQKVNNLSNSYLNIIKLENCVLTLESSSYNHLTIRKWEIYLKAICNQSFRLTLVEQPTVV